MVYDRWTLHIDKVTTDFLREFSRLNDFELNWKPNPNIWSIAQNVDHVMMVNNSYFPLIHALKVAGYKPHFITKIRLYVERASQHGLESVDPDRFNRVKTNPKWEPSDGLSDISILNSFEQHQICLKQLVTDSYDLLDSKAIITSPINKLLVIKLSTAFDIMVSHEKRHFKQAVEVMELMQRKLAAAR